MKKLALCLISVLIAMSSVANAYGQKYSLNTAMELAATLDNNPTAGPLPAATARYPGTTSGIWSMRFDATGEKSVFGFRYDYGMTRTRADSYTRSETHSSTLDYTGRVTKNTRLTLTDTYFRSPSLTTFNFVHGVIGAEAVPFQDSGTIASNRKTQANILRGAVEYATSPHSSWAFGLAHDIHRYGETASATTLASSTTQQITADILYTHRPSTRTSWTAGYTGSQYAFSQTTTDDARTHDLALGVSHVLTQNTLLNLSGGPSYMETLGASGTQGTIGFNARLSIAKTLRKNQLSIGYTRRNGATAGVGASDIQTIAFDHSRQFGKFLNLHTALSIYDSRQRRSSTFQVRGASAAVIAGIPFGKHVSLNIGANYQKQQGNEVFYADRRQVFLSLRFALPEIGRSRK